MEPLTDIEEIMTSTGAHEGHHLEQIGRCVYCSCGSRVQGRIPKKQRLEVILPDAFVCWRGYDKVRAEEVALRHEGAVIRPSTE